MKKKPQLENAHKNKRQRGQSLILIVFAMIGLIAFVGIAVDVGLVYVRRSQLNKAVDAAVLAAVTEVETSSEDLDPARDRATQFLNNNLPVTATHQSINPPAIIDFMDYRFENEDLGIIEYTITATWPVELYFLKVIGLESTDVVQAATAAYFPVTDIYASRRVEDGALSTSNQSVFGPSICSSFGDPFSPLTPAWTRNDADPDNDTLFDGVYTYKYRILIPQEYYEAPPNGYGHDVVRVELFDPDSINRLNNNGGSYTTDVQHTKAWIDSGRPAVETLSCTSNNKNPCLIDTAEDELLGLPLDQVNPWWFVRIDENRGAGSPRGNGSCGSPSEYDARYNTRTLFELYYFAQHDDGTIMKEPLAQYTGQVGDNERDSGDHDTDMRWVSPGGALSYDQSSPVPADDGNSFEVSISNDLTNILTDPETGNSYIYVGVTTISGASENGFEIWAGPPDYVGSIASDVNIRNIQVINTPGAHSSDGISVFAMGNLPLNSNFGPDAACTNPTIPLPPECNAVDIPLIYVPAEYAGQTVTVSLFDTDAGAKPPIIFYFDTIAESDWSMVFGNGNDPDGLGAGRCLPGGCHDEWVTPPYQITIPRLDTDPTDDGIACTNPADPAQMDICTPFFGGRLVARYIGGQDDTYGWEIRLPGDPFLVK